MEELDLKEFFSIFWNRKGVIILIILIFAFLGYVYTKSMVTPQYKSSTTLILAKSDDINGGETSQKSESITQTEVTLNQKLVSTYSELIKSKSVLRQVISNLNIDTSEAELSKNISITSVNNTEVIKITVVNVDPKRAANIANEISIVFSDKISEIYNINNVHVVDKAEVEKSPYNVNKIKDILTFSFVGIIIACIYAIIANMLDTTVKTPEDIEKYIKLPVLASVPLCDMETRIKKGGNK